MDQPQNNQDNMQDNAVDSGVPPQDITAESTATPINVNVQSEEETTMSDPVMEGVPSASDGSASSFDTMPQAETAQDAPTGETPPDELAAVASELESMASSGVPVDQPVEPTASPDSGGTDPMQQIMQEAESQPLEEPMGGDINQALEALPSEPMVEPGSSENTDMSNTPVEESASGDVAGMETENEFGETPATEEQASDMNETAPVVGNEVVAAAPEPEATDESTNTAADTPEAPMQESETPSETPSVMPLSSEPGSEASSSEESESSSEETAAPSSAVNDVVAPTAVAAAVAAGTAGDNAITGTPEATSVDAAQEAPKAVKAPKQKSSKAMIVVVVALVTLLFGGGAVAAYMMQPAETEDTATAQETDESSTDEIKEDDLILPEDMLDTAEPGDVVEANALDDYKALCGTGGMVTNATAYAGKAPHPIVVFEKGSDDKFAQSLMNFKDATWSASASSVETAQLVGCISRVASSEVKLKDCPITDSVTKVTAEVGFYSSKYTVDVYEALTGKKVTTFENASTSTTCPTNAVYNKEDPKIFAGFDQIALETSLADTVSKSL